MKKITLESLFDSLDADNIDEAKSKLHSWLVSEGKRIHAEMNGNVIESEDDDDSLEEGKVPVDDAAAEKNADDGSETPGEVDESFQSVAETTDEYVVEVSYDLDDQAENYQDHIETILQQKAVDVDHVGEAVYLLFYVNGADHASEVEQDIAGLSDQIAGLQAHSKPSSLYNEGNTSVEEERVDELSRDAMMTYAKAARKDRDRAGEDDDERVGRRVSGLDMIANKARRERAKPQYESDDYVVHEEVAEESEDDLIADLAEAFAGLKTVAHTQTKDGTEVGKAGKVKTNTKSTLPMKKKDKREGGEAVEIKSDDHTGFAIEKAPKVKDAPKKDIENAKQDPKKVSVKGGKALLNKKDGFGSDSPESPISGKGM